MFGSKQKKKNYGNLENNGFSAIFLHAFTFFIRSDANSCMFISLLHSPEQAFRNDSKERKERVTIPFFPKGTERNEE